MLKQRGTVASLSAARPGEVALVQEIEQAVDSNPLCAGLIAELVAECRSRSLATPDEPSWHFLQGRFLMAAGSPTEAREALERAALLDPKDPRIAAHLGLWYEAALLATTGATTNVELPGAAGPGVTASAAHFAAHRDALSASELADRAQEHFARAMTFRLPSRDRRFLERHSASARDNATTADVRPLQRKLLHAV